MNIELQEELRKLRANFTGEIPDSVPRSDKKEKTAFADDKDMEQAEQTEGLIRAEELAKRLNLSVRRIQQLRADGALVTVKSKFGMRYHVTESLFALAKHLLARQDTASNRARAVRAEAEYKENRAELSKLEIRRRKGELHESHHVRELMNGWATIIKSTLQTIPGRIAVSLSLCKNENECAAVVRGAINEALAEICEHDYNPQAFRKLVEDEGGYYVETSAEDPKKEE